MARLRPTGGGAGRTALDPPQPPRPLWRWRGRDLVSRVGTVQDRAPDRDRDGA
jgi:hypothetical protein